MNNYFKYLEEKISKNVKFENLEIIDNSQKHKGHKSFSKEKYHLHLKFKSNYLSSISRLSAHKMILEILNEDLKTKIHALEISIEQ